MLRLIPTILLVTACSDAGSPASGPHPLPIGKGDITTIVGSGSAHTDPLDADHDGKVDDSIPVLLANVFRPMDVALHSGKMFVVESRGQKIRVVQGDHLAFFTGTGFEGDGCDGARSDDQCPLGSTELNNPTGIAFDSSDGMLIAAWQNSKIKRADLTTQGVVDLCGTGDRNYKGDGGKCRDDAGTSRVSFDLPSSVALDAHDNLFVSDQSNQVVRRLARSGVVTTVAGTCPGTPGFGCPAGHGYSGDGGPATLAELGNYISQSADPQGRIAIDVSGNLYIADTDNSVVRKVSPGSDGVLGDGDPAEEIISTVAGNGTPGYSGDGGPATAAQLAYPTDVAVGENGELYIADRGNSCVRRVAVDGTVDTIAGQCGKKGFSGDGGPATEALLANAYGVELDASGALYISDTDNNRIRKVLLR